MIDVRANGVYAVALSKRKQTGRTATPLTRRVIDMNIEGAVVLVTGASSGIGEATARPASRGGARAVLPARRKDRIQKLAEEPGDALAIRCDVTDPVQVLTMLSSVARVELAGTGIAVSTMFPFITATEFIDSIKAGKESAKELESSTTGVSHKPEQVAEKILDLIRTGDERADLVPEQFVGTCKG